jgi:hypothetical protein
MQSINQFAIILSVLMTNVVVLNNIDDTLAKLNWVWICTNWICYKGMGPYLPTKQINWRLWGRNGMYNTSNNILATVQDREAVPSPQVLTPTYAPKL